MASEKPDVKNILSKIKEFFGNIAGSLRKAEWDPKKMTTSQKRKMLVYGAGALLILLVLIIIIALIVHAVSSRKDTAESGYTFMTDGYEEIVDAETVDEEITVYTDSTGSKGIISLDGVITEKADQEKIYSVSSEWRKSQIVAEGSSSEYLLYVDTETGKVLTRQYQDVTEAPREAVWSDENNALVWRYSNGSVSSVEPSDIVLAAGLYPVAYYSGTGKTYGYIDQNFNLVIGHTFSDACDFSEGLAAVERGSQWGYIDETGTTVIPIEYSAIGDEGYSFRNGLAPVKNSEGLCGIISRSGATVCRFDFDKILQGKDGKYLAQKDGKWGLLTVNADVYSAENTAPETTTSASVMYIVKTSGGTLNMRDAASTDGTKITEIPNGTEVEYIESGDGWIKVRYNDMEGWVSAAYVEQVS